MRFSRVSQFRRTALATVAFASLAPTAALAQQADDEETGNTPSSEIVVTGTILRGAAPVGSNLISVGQERIQSQGANTANELLATIPQVSNLFNNTPLSRLSVSAQAIQVVRPNLRNLSPETSSTASTLVLFDGHRIAGVGVTQQAIDPDLIPTGAIERVEVVTDGGSATYGSDAIGGVINFITRKRFDGVKVDARYGFADNYWTINAGATIGKDWGSGSLYASYEFQKNDALYGRDRDFIRGVDWGSTALTPLGRACTPGNIQIAGAVAGAGFYPLPSLNPAAGPNTCDLTDDLSLLPAAKRHSALVSLHQELADWLTVDVRAFYGERSSVTYAPLRGSVTVTGGSNAANPRQTFYIPIPANPAVNQLVHFSFAPILGDKSAPQGSAFQEWGVNAEFAANLNENWQLRTLFNYSRSNSNFFETGFNDALLNAAARTTIAAQAVNYYNPGSTPDLNLIRAIADNYDRAGQAKDDLIDLRAILDGGLFELPGGSVRLAVGYEFMHDSFAQRSATSDVMPEAFATRSYVPYERDVHSVFGELQIPIFGESNRTGGFYFLIINGSVRHDRYSDFGNTTNPKIGVTWKPLEWLSLRGNYSTSFNAPAPIDQLGALRNFITTSTAIAFIKPGDSINRTAAGLVALQGSTPGLKPQTASTYSFGVDIDVPFVPGLRATVNYYNVKFENLLDSPTPSARIFTDFPGNITSAPVANGTTVGLPRQLVEDFANQVPGGAAQIQPFLNSGLPIYEIIDFRRGNYGTLKVEGLDFDLRYRTATMFGGLDASVSGNYQLSRLQQRAKGGAFLDSLRANQTLGLDADSRLTLQATVGADIGQFRAQVTWNHTSGRDIASNASVFQTHIDAFNTINVFFKYDVPGDSFLLKNLRFTVNVNNVFDKDPPILRSNATARNGFEANFFNAGRYVQLGVSKKF